MKTLTTVPDLIMVMCGKGEFRAKPADGATAFEDVNISVRAEQDDALSIQVRAETTPVSVIKLRWQLSEPLKGQICGDAWERTYGDAGWTGMVPYRAMPWYFMVHHDNQTALYGVKVRPGAMCFWQADPAGITLWLDVRCGGEGVVLNGRTLSAATVVSAVYEDISAYEAARRFCTVMCTDPIFPPEPVYGSNNWYYAYGHSSEEEILADTDYIVRLTEGLENRPYMVIDDCWQPNRCDEYIGGPWDGGNERFPDMPHIAQKLVDKGTKPGIWFRPLLDREAPDEWKIAKNGALDPSHPEVLAKVAADVKRICDWGFQLIKHDFSTFDSFGRWGFDMQPFVTEHGWHFYDRSKTSAEILVNFYRTILEAAQPYGTLILGCNTVGHLAAGLEHMQRTGDDTSGVLWERTLRMGVNALAFRMPQHRTFFDCDADCLGVSGSIPWTYNRMWGELLGKSGTSLFVSVKPGVLTPEEEAELASFLAEGSRQEHIAQPLDWQETIYPQDWKNGEERLHYDWYQDIGLREVRGPGGVWERLHEESAFPV